MDEIKQTFEKYDADGNGYISYREAHEILHEELGFDETKTANMIQTYDRNGDNRLSYEEFIWFYWKIQEKKELLDKVFRKFDADGSGAVSLQEAKNILKELNFPEQDIVALLKTHDSNHDGLLQFEEFVHFWNDCGGKVPKEFITK